MFDEISEKPLRRKLIPCARCGKLLEGQQALKSHAQAKHSRAGKKPKKLRCPECNAPASLIEDSASHYGGANMGSIWACDQCDTRVRCHPGTTKPLGTMADSSTRRARGAAHRAFDPIWKIGQLTRSEAYAWMAEALDIPPEKCHIGLFDAPTCERIVKLCLNFAPPARTPVPECPPSLTHGMIPP